MAISRSQMNRQLRATGGIMNVTPRENFGLGSSLKKFVRKIIPNEISDIAVKAAPFVAPFNPALAAAMGGIGTFDQTGSISAGLKSGAMNYGSGQLARYAGGAGFQGNPFGDGGAFTGSGFRGGFSSPLGNKTGLGKYFSGQGTDAKSAVQGVGGNAENTGLFTEGLTGGNVANASELSYVPNNATSALVDASDMQLVGDVKQAASQEFNLFKAAADKVRNFDYREAGGKALELGKKFGKAAFTNKDGSVDKAAVIGAIAFAGSYMEAQALAADAGVEITEEVYDEARKAEKQEEYAGYLTNFFEGQKDGGRIGYKDGTLDPINIGIGTFNPERVKELYEDVKSIPGKISSISLEDLGITKRTELDYPYDKSEYSLDDFDLIEETPKVLVMNKDGETTIMDEKLAKTLGLKIIADSFDTEQMLVGEEKAKGGRISRKLGSPEEGEGGGVMEMLSVDVEANPDEDESIDSLMAGGITFSSAEKSFLFKRLGGSGGASRSYTMPQLYKILNNPQGSPQDARALKRITIGLGIGKKDGGRIGYKGGANRVSELLVLRDEALGKGEDVSIFDAELFQLTGKTFRSIGGIGDIPTGQMRKNNVGVVERDYRDEGGFVPVGIKERADDVPAMLSKNEFVMTADAVRGIGNGSVEEGSKKLYNTMKQAEQKGKVA